MTTGDSFDQLKTKILNAVGEDLYVRKNYPEYILLEAKTDEAVVRIRNCLVELHVKPEEFESPEKKRMFIVRAHEKTNCIIV